ncbi:MAG TPA: TonB-dependent receptor [Bryobacteraceae bacterium]|jgi:hypothetical protein|nr:TonB-dependent receptor [Bryobacteraceae bacterium]
MKWKAISRRLRYCAIACLAVLTLAAAEHHGVVKFGNVPVPGATVTANMDDKKMAAVTDENGLYTFPDLAEGTWKVTVEMPGFAIQTKEIGVVSGAPGAEWELKMLTLDEIKPAVQAAPPPPATATPAPGAPATPSLSTSAPATAAATPAPKGKGKKGAAPATPQAGFQRTDLNASGDTAPSGAASNAPPSIAEAQSSSDAFVVNGSTSNGIERRAIGNGRRGPRSLFTGGIDFRSFQNDLLDARSYSTTGQDIPRSPYNHFTVGAQLQGPLWIPHVFHWQGNFFLQFQTTRLRNASTTPSTMPTAAERAGNFQGVATIIDPTTGQPFANNTIPAIRISPQAQYFLNFYPLPQFTASTPLGYNFEVPLISRSVSDQFSARFNKPVNTKSSVQGQFGFQDNSNDNENALAWLDVTKVFGARANVAYTRNFTRTFYGRMFVEYSRYSVKTTPFFANKTNVSGQAGITGNDQTPSNWGPPSLGFSNFFGISDANQNFIRNQTPAVGTVITYIHRPHNFQFGGDFKVQDLSTVGQSNGRGAFGFNGQLTGFDFADFLLGVPDTSAINYGNPDKYLKSNLYDLFINDNWNVNSSLTFQWGVRWDYNSPFTEKYGRLANLDVLSGFSSAIPVTAQDPLGSLTGNRYPDSLVRPDKHQFSPRLSVAWRPFFGSSMLVRGGYGIYYNTSIYQGIASAMDEQAPFAKSLSLTNSVNNPLTLASGFNPSAAVTSDTFAVDPNLRVGYSQNYYVSVQQNVTASLLMTVQYNGVQGSRLLQEFQPNTYLPGVENPCPACLAGYTYLQSTGTSSRNAGQVSLRRRFHGGFQTNLTYTFSKSIDDSGSLISYGGSGGGAGGAFTTSAVAQDWRNLRGERGPSNFDQRHLLNVTFQYTTGVGVRGGGLLSGWRGLLFKGWTVQSNITVGSGLPFTPVYVEPLSPTGISVVRPDYVGGNVYGGPGGLFLNPLAFQAPPAGQFGNLGRNALYGPNQFSMNGSMARSFQDKYTVTFAATNLLNHPVFSSVYSSFDPVVDPTTGQPNYGKFGTFLPPGAMRQITATFRWTF